jgi:hypothetical protein
LSFIFLLFGFYFSQKPLRPDSNPARLQPSGFITSHGRVGKFGNNGGKQGYKRVTIKGGTQSAVQPGLKSRDIPDLVLEIKPALQKQPYQTRLGCECQTLNWIP